MLNNEENTDTLRTNDKTNKSKKIKKALQKEEMRLRFQKIVDEALETKKNEKYKNDILADYYNKHTLLNHEQEKIKQNTQINSKIKRVKKSKKEKKNEYGEISVNDPYEYVCQNCFSKNVIVESYEGYLYLVCINCKHAVLAGIDDEDNYDGPVHLEGSYDGTIDNMENILEKDYERGMR